ncbi:hypothetical protein V6N13_108583 [Hibiscus sabdariffa]
MLRRLSPSRGHVRPTIRDLKGPRLTIGRPYPSSENPRAAGNLKGSKEDKDEGVEGASEVLTAVRARRGDRWIDWRRCERPLDRARVLCEPLDRRLRLAWRDGEDHDTWQIGPSFQARERSRNVSIRDLVGACDSRGR